MSPSAKIVVELDFNFNVRERELPSVTRCLDVIYLCDDVQKLQTNMCERRININISFKDSLIITILNNKLGVHVRVVCSWLL